MEQNILEPLSEYFGQYRERHRQLAEQYFDDLVKQSGVSAEENAALMSERDKVVAKLRKEEKFLAGQKSVKTFLITAAVLLLVAGILTLFALLGEPNQWIGILVISLCGAAAIALVCLVIFVFNKRIKRSSEVAESYQKQQHKIESRAWKMMRPLNALYDWNIPDGLIYQTVPQIRLDKYFDEDKLAYFDSHCRLAAYDEDSSALCVKSGNSDGRPFLYVRFLRQTMRPHTYTGSRVVTWTEEVTDAQGNSHTVMRSQTLIANVVKPEPYYFNSTDLFFGCEAAPDLHFDRSPTVPHNADEKQVESMVKKGEKKLEKKARKAVSAGESFNKLANSKFEVLFGADNRDNEVQFRLMFTPLAQQNMVNLLTSKQPYGDDFYFSKQGVVNVISSTHSAGLQLDADPEIFADFDLKNAKDKFVRFNCDYFRAVYFDFAPLFSVPLYTQDPPVNKFDMCTKPGSIGSWEAETVANRFNSSLLVHPLSATQPILKATSDIGADQTVAHVTAYTFEAIPQVDFVPVWCMNGNLYDVAVPWTLYEPLEQKTDIVMQAVDMTKAQFDSSEHGKDIFFAGIRAHISK